MSGLVVTVSHGNLRFVRAPLMLGHYRALALTGAEAAMDRLIGGVMGVSLELGRYPDEPGVAEVFINHGKNNKNPLQLPRPEAVIVVGLGEEGKLAVGELVRTVRQGVIAWAQHVWQRSASVPAHLELAATLIGSGGSEISVGQSARLVTQGVLEANARLSRLQLPCVYQLAFTELFLDRATEAWSALREQAATTGRGFAVAELIHSGSGGLRRPLDANYRGTGYDLMSATAGERDDGTIWYTLDTKRAGTQLRAHATQAGLVKSLVAGASDDKNRDPNIGRTLFRLLVPVDLEPFLAGSSDLVIEVDDGTSGVPWEMLDSTDAEDGTALPWAIRTRLLRKLLVPNARRRIVDAPRDACALVVGEPASDYPRLPEAQAEAKIVFECLKKSGSDSGWLRDLFSPDPLHRGPNARTVINALYERSWRVIHITGHGEGPSSAAPEGRSGTSSRADPRGVVLSDGHFLGSREIAGMRVVPELVFVNCCHSAARAPEGLFKKDGQAASGSYDRPSFAAGLAQSLIEIGVCCVIAAGWAVEQGAAAVFATTFYERLLNRARFIDAVAAARHAAWAKGGNTWAAFQCYGDPDWTLRSTADAVSIAATPSEIFANVASPDALLLALENIAVNGKYDGADRARLEEQIVWLEGRFASRWGDRGAVAEAFGAAWAPGHRENAMKWYARALAANDGKASIRAAEQLGNFRVRAAEASLKTSTNPAVLDCARAEMVDALAGLERIAAIQPTVERLSLCGSAWKRIAMLEVIAGCHEATLRAIARMKACYTEAETLARKNEDPELFYPALNCMGAELIIDGATPDWPGFASERVQSIRASLEAAASQNPEFWSIAGLADLRVYEAIARRELASKLASIEGEYLDLQRRVNSRTDWASVHDQIRFILVNSSWLVAAERKAGEGLLEALAAFAR